MPELVQDEDDVEFLYESGPMTCQICSTPLQKLSPAQRHTHYELHFANEPQTSSSGSARPLPTAHKTPPKARLRSRAPAKYVPPAKQNEFWTQMQFTAPPKNFTPGLIPTLKRALLKTHAKGLTTRAMLCHEGAIHVATELWDIGWGCGYRNFLMACTALFSQSVQPLYFPLLDDPTPPGVRNLQFWIEDAWANGTEGAEQLKHQLTGTKKWIGTAELYVAFVSRGIPAQLVDFPGSERGPEALTEWVTNYFSPPVLSKGQTDAFNALKGASPVLCTERMPLILQHSGHSRTVVGVEVTKKGSTNLLVFDPSRRPGGALRNAALAYHLSMASASRAEGGSSSILQRVLHPHSHNGHGKSRKRRASSPSLDKDGHEVKRARGEAPRPVGKDDAANVLNDSVGHLDDNQDDVVADVEHLDPSQVVSFFRVNQSKLGKKDKYQILWFPLDPPLEETERWARRVVTSEQIV